MITKPIHLRGLFLCLLLTPILSATSAENAWKELAGRNAVRPEFRYVENEASLPNVLIYGDSISIGYMTTVQDRLDGKANVYRLFRNGSDSNKFIQFMTKMHETMTDPALDRPWDFAWDVIHFNVGLHDLKYVFNGKLDLEKGAVVSPIAVYKQNLKEILDYLTTLAPDAQLVFALTTPVIDDASGRRSGDEVRYNNAALEVLKEWPKVVVNDLYSPTKSNFDDWMRAAGDVHYNDVGERAQGEIVSEKILSVLKQRSE